MCREVVTDLYSEASWYTAEHLNHSAYAVFDDAAIPAGAAVLAEMALGGVRA